MVCWYSEHMPSRHVIISGTGRAGTTFLVQLLTELGFDTGFTSKTDGVFAACHAGMERDLREPGAPFIVKSPYICDYLDDVMRRGDVEVVHAIVPMRNLFAAAESRREIQRQSGQPPSVLVPGGLWGVTSPAEQEASLATQFFKLMAALTRHDIPSTLLEFPRLVADPEYTYRKLAFLVEPIGWERFLGVFQLVADPNLVHEFTNHSDPVPTDR
jgi:hypothetical protein